MEHNPDIAENVLVTSGAERTSGSPLTLSAWASLDFGNEAMEILDPCPDFGDWRGVRPGWSMTTIYIPPKRTA